VEARGNNNIAETGKLQQGGGWRIKNTSVYGYINSIIPSLNQALITTMGDNGRGLTS
jgi:hypothetical protein